MLKVIFHTIKYKKLINKVTLNVLQLAALHYSFLPSCWTFQLADNRGSNLLGFTYCFGITFKTAVATHSLEI